MVYLFLQVIDNLKIAHIEARFEDDPAIAPYVHEKQVEYVKCERGVESNLKVIKKEIDDLMKDATSRLHVAEVLNCSNTNNMNTVVINEARRNLKDMVDDERISLERTKSLSLDLDELSIFVSVRKELSENVSKSGLQRLENLKSTSTCLPQGLRTTVQSIKFIKLLSVVRRAHGGSGKAEKSQPRMSKLKEILEEHFQRRARVQASTKVIVFTALRSTVNDIVADLSDTPGVTAKAFIGQASSAGSNGQGGIKGLTQLEQAAILKSFNAGSMNVLVATSVAEEGLDIDEVDLIVFFEAVKSPIRNMQRMGRTGRKRSGRIVILTVEGDQDKIESSHNSTSSVCKVLKDPLNYLRLYKDKKDSKKKCLNLPPSDDVKIILQKFDIEEFRLSQVGSRANIKTTSKVCKDHDLFHETV